MEKKFRIGSSRRYCESHYIHPPDTTAKVVWKIVELDGIEFYAGAVFTNDLRLAGSMCGAFNSELEFCQALLRKAYGTRKPFNYGPHKKFYEEVNIYNRKFRQCTNPNWWEWWPYSPTGAMWVCKPKPSRMKTTRR